MNIYQTAIVYLIITYLFIIFIYPVVKYTIQRFYLTLRCRFLPRGCFFISRLPFWAFWPRFLSKKPDFAIYCNNKLYLFKLFAFRRRRKNIIFLNDRYWQISNKHTAMTNNHTFRYEEGNIYDKITAFEHKIKAPAYMIKYAHALQEKLKATAVVRCIPVVLFVPSVKKMQTAGKIRVDTGDFIFYGMMVGDLSCITDITKKSEKIPDNEKKKIQRIIKNFKKI